jgi:DnaJ-domain-containing protein 1
VGHDGRVSSQLARRVPARESAQAEPVQGLDRGGAKRAALGVDRGANADTIRAAYRELAIVHHPDRGGNPQQMAELNRAWQEARA